MAKKKPTKRSSKRKRKVVPGRFPQGVPRNTPPKRPGPPPKLNEHTCAAVERNLRTGAPLETAAAAAGIVRETLRTWLRRGERAREELDKTGRLANPEDEIYAAFSERCEIADCGWQIDAMRSIQQASENPHYWAAAAWRLERRKPADYGKGERSSSEAEERAGSQLDQLMQTMHEQREQEREAQEAEG